MRTEAALRALEREGGQDSVEWLTLAIRGDTIPKDLVRLWAYLGDPIAREVWNDRSGDGLWVGPSHCDGFVGLMRGLPQQGFKAVCEGCKGNPSYCNGHLLPSYECGDCTLARGAMCGCDNTGRLHAHPPRWLCVVGCLAVAQECLPVWRDHQETLPNGETVFTDHEQVPGPDGPWITSVERVLNLGQRWVEEPTKDNAQACLGANLVGGIPIWAQLGDVLYPGWNTTIDEPVRHRLTSAEEFLSHERVRALFTRAVIVTTKENLWR